jgi:hypothetical protein
VRSFHNFGAATLQALMVAQLVEVLILYGMLTPHLPGRAPALLVFKPLIEAAVDFKQLQAA